MDIQLFIAWAVCAYTLWCSGTVAECQLKFCADFIFVSDLIDVLTPMKYVQRVSYINVWVLSSALHSLCVSLCTAVTWHMYLALWYICSTSSRFLPFSATCTLLMHLYQWSTPMHIPPPRHGCRRHVLTSIKSNVPNRASLHQLPTIIMGPVLVIWHVTSTTMCTGDTAATLYMFGYHVLFVSVDNDYYTNIDKK